MIPRQRSDMFKLFREGQTIRPAGASGLCAKYSDVVLVQSFTIGRVLCTQYCELTLRQMAAHKMKCSNKRLTVLSRLSTRSARLSGAWRVPKTPFVWKAELGGAPDSAFSAQLGSVTYYAVTRSYGHPAYIEVRGARRGLKRLDLGTYVKLEQAKQACERHYRAGCDLSKAERIIPRGGSRMRESLMYRICAGGAR